MKLLESSFILLLALQSSISQRITSNLLLQYNFQLDDCRDGVPFPNSGSGSGFDLESLDLGITGDPPTYECPNFENDTLSFDDSSNGFSPQNTSSPLGLTSDGDITTALGTSFSAEFWVFITDRVNQMILMEISQSSQSGSWSAGTSNQFDVQVMLRRVDEVQVTFSRGADSDDRISFDISSLSDLSLIHLVLTFDGTNAELYLNGVQATGDTVTNFGYGSNRVLTLGGGYGIDGSDRRSLSGAIVYFALYNAVLSAGDVEDNFDAGLIRNNEPVISDLTLEKVEDVELTIDLLEGAFDLDNLQPLDSDDDIFFVIDTNPNNGFFELDGIEQNTFPFVVSPGEILTYQQTTPNVNDVEDVIAVGLSSDSNVDANDFDDLLSAQYTIDFVEANDDPTSNNVERFLPLSTNIEIPLSGEDIDFPALDSDLIPTNFIIYQVEEGSDNLGFLYDCDGAVSALSFPITVEAEEPTGQETTFTANICYQAGSEGVADEEGVIGIQLFQYVLEDGAGGSSSNATITVNVVLDLFVGCGDVGGTPCDDTIEEGQDILVELKAVDSLCDVDNPPAECDDRDKVIYLVEPLMDISVGQLSYVDPDSGDTIVITDDLFEDNVGGTPIRGYALPVNFASVTYTPGENYFNLAEHPLCSTGTDLKCAGFLINNFNNDAVFPCVGEFCDDFTMNSLLDEPINQCTEPLEGGGCPAEIHFRFGIGSLISPSVDTLGHIVWVKNEQTTNEEQSLSMNRNISYDIRGRLDERIVLSTLADGPIIFNDTDANVRNMQVEIQLRSNFDGSARLTLDINSSVFPTNIVNLVITNDPITDEDGVEDTSACFFTGCEIRQSIIIGAPLTTVNEIVERLQVQVFDRDLEEQVIELSVEYGFIENTPNEISVVIPITVRNDPDRDLTFEDYLGLVYIFCGIFFLCFLYKTAGVKKKQWATNRKRKGYKPGEYMVDDDERSSKSGGSTKKKLAVKRVPHKRNRRKSSSDDNLPVANVVKQKRKGGGRTRIRDGPSSKPTNQVGRSTLGNDYVPLNKSGNKGRRPRVVENRKPREEKDDIDVSL
eukprot:augustus_masked-scaffold_8-processed-gene-7.11-mRNA-1 protein AED:1.00 eAED:1.00 QI:0/-1/0/0/-1/1/1/0/1057